MLMLELCTRYSIVQSMPTIINILVQMYVFFAFCVMDLGFFHYSFRRQNNKNLTFGNIFCCFAILLFYRLNRRVFEYDMVFSLYIAGVSFKQFIQLI